MVRETAPQYLRHLAKTGPMGDPGNGSASGFSLVELIVVITITGIIASVIGAFITGPVQGFFDQARRAALVDAGQLALLRMGRDLRAALPNSVRVNGPALELLLTLDGDRYRTEPATDLSPAGPDDQLEFNVADTSFNTFRQLGAGQVVPAGVRLAIYPLGPGTAADPYASGTASVLTPSTKAVTLGGTSVLDGTAEHRVAINPGHRFPFESPSHRVFLVSGPVTYYCNGGDLLRYEGYAVAAAQPIPPAGGITTVVIAGIVRACTFNYDAGTARRNAVAALTLELADPAQPAEVVRLVRQVHLSNVP